MATLQDVRVLVQLMKKACAKVKDRQHKNCHEHLAVVLHPANFGEVFKEAYPMDKSQLHEIMAKELIVDGVKVLTSVKAPIF